MQSLRLLSRFLLGLAGIAACWFAWWTVYQDSLARVADTKPGAAEVEIAVEVMPARRGAVSERLELVGSLAPRSQVDIRARAAGYITTLPYDVGDVIEAGGTVVYLDDTTEAEAIESAAAALQVVQAERDARQAEFEYADSRFQRQQRLFENGGGTEQQFEEAESARRIAEAQVALQSARVTEAESNLQQARLALQDLRISSPIHGVVARRLVDVGDLAQPETPLLEIVDLQTLETVVHVVERDYSKLQRGNIAEIRVDAFPDCTFQGTVRRIAPVVDPDTRTAAVQIEVPNPDELLKPGMHTRVGIIYQSRPRSEYVPIGAVVENGRDASLFVVTGEPPQVEQRPVTLGISDGRVVEIIDGIDEGDDVVTLGQRLLEHGQVVRALRVPWPASLDLQPVGLTDEELPAVPSQ
jgi:RND family efflux transporter MFP subunit